MLVWFKKDRDSWGHPIVLARLREYRQPSQTWNEVNERGEHYFAVTLVDNDHQSLIETIDRVWPDWRDGDCFLAHAFAEVEAS